MNNPQSQSSPTHNRHTVSNCADSPTEATAQSRWFTWQVWGLIFAAILLTSLGAPNRWLHWYPAALLGLSPLFYLGWNCRSIRQQMLYCGVILLGFCALVFVPDPLSVPALTTAETVAGALVSPIVPLYFMTAALMSLQLSRPCPLWLRPLAIAAVWTAFDGIFALLQLPLPLHYGACLFDFTRAIQIADITGIWGVTFLAIFSNAVLAALFVSFEDRTSVKDYSLRHGWSRRIAILLPVVVLWSTALLYGGHQESLFRPTGQRMVNSETFTVGTVQQVAWLSGDRNRQYRRNRYREMVELSQEALADGTELLVWPEGAMRIQVAGSIDESLFVHPLLESLPDGGGLIVGSSELAPVAGSVPWDERKFINMALLYDPSGTIRDRYGKQWLFKYFETSRFVPSDAGYAPLTAGDLLGLVGTQICLESVMPRASRELVRSGAESLVVISDDSWFGRSNWPILHSVLSVFRAIENRRSFVFVNNTGSNLVVTPAGDIVAAGQLWQQRYVNGPVYRLNTRTIANQWGDWLVWVCLLVLAGLGLWGCRWRKL
ncbi:MAG: nitrilase-related carbon-nitrogen hydrolase [Cyanobacteria bacterium P01_E01_bin.34]